MYSKENKTRSLANQSSSTPIECRVYASEGEKLIQYDLNSDDATLIRKWSITLPAFIQAGWFHPTKPFFYLALSKGGYAAEVPIEEHYLMAFKIESSTLTPIGLTITLPYRPVHICMDSIGVQVLVTYNTPPRLTIHDIKEDGSFAEPFKMPDLTMRKYPHQVMVSPQNDFITVCATGQEMIMDSSGFRGAIHVFGYKNGALTGNLNSVSLNDGLRFSPRHLEFHPHLPLAYVSLERQNELHVYRYDHKGFDPEPLFTHTTLFGGASKSMQLCGTVKIHPSGRYVYVANRTLGWYEENGKKMLAKGGDDIAVFEIHALTGSLTPVQRIDSQGIMPRTMSFDAQGKLLIVANQFEVEALDGTEMKHIPQSLVVYKINTNGQLKLANKYPLKAYQKPMIWMGVQCRKL